MSHACVFKDCSFKCKIKRVPHPLFGFDLPIAYMDEFVAHTCEPLTHAPRDYPSNSKELATENSKYVQSIRLLRSNPSWSFMEDLEYVFIPKPEGYVPTNEQKKILWEEYNSSMKLHPKFTMIERDESFRYDRVYSLGIETENYFSNFHLPALNILAHSPNTTVKIVYGDDPARPGQYALLPPDGKVPSALTDPLKTDGNKETKQDGDNNIVVDERGDQLDIEINNQEQQYVSLIKASNNNKFIKNFKESQRVSVAIGNIFSRFEESSPAEDTLTRLVIVGSFVPNILKDKLLLGPEDSTEDNDFHQNQITKIKSVMREYKKDDKLQKKFSIPGNGSLVKTYQVGTIEEEYERHFDGATTSSDTNTATTNVSSSPVSEPLSVTSPSASISTTASTSSLNSCCSKLHENKQPSLYEVDPQVPKYLENLKLQSSASLDPNQSYCQRNGCSLNNGHVHCDDPLHAIFSGSEQIDHQLKFPVSTLSHLIHHWYEDNKDDVDHLSDMKIKSLFFSSPSMKKIAKIVDPIITIVPMMLEHPYESLVLYSAVAQTSSYIPHILGFGIYDISIENKEMLFLEQFKEATKDVITSEFSFITKVRKGLYSAIEHFFPNNSHFPCLQDLIHNAAKVRLISDTKRDRFLGLIYKLHICVSKERAQNYHQELMSMIDHLYYLNIPIYSSPEEEEEENSGITNDHDGDHNDNDTTSMPANTNLIYNILIDIDNISWAYSGAARFNQVTSNLSKITSGRIIEIQKSEPLSFLIKVFNSEIQVVESEWTNYFNNKLAGKFVNDDEWLIPGVIDNLSNAYLHIDNYQCTKMMRYNEEEYFRTGKKGIYKVELLEKGLLSKMLKKGHKPSELNYLYGSCNRPFYNRSINKLTHLRVGRVNSAFMKEEYWVDLQERTCSCGYWQNNQYPCIHVLQVAVEHEIPVSSLCHERYLMKTHVKTFYEILNNDKVIDPSISEMKIVRNLIKSFTLKEEVGNNKKKNDDEEEKVRKSQQKQGSTSSSVLSGKRKHSLSNDK